MFCRKYWVLTLLQPLGFTQCSWSDPWIESGVSENAVSGHKQFVIRGKTACFVVSTGFYPLQLVISQDRVWCGSECCLGPYTVCDSGRK